VREELAERSSTERLSLERWDTGRHTAALVAMNGDPEVMRFIGDGGIPTRAQSARQSAAIAAHWERFGFGLWALRLSDDPSEQTGPVIGFAGLAHPLWWPAESANVEVGWRLRRDAWGRGYASEAARAAVDTAFGPLGLRGVVSYIRAGNARSQSVARRLGMQVERVAAPPAHREPLEVWVLRADRPRCAGA
jgi:RimJ/RimL family protein N-acetyltransferase